MCTHSHTPNDDSTMFPLMIRACTRSPPLYFSSHVTRRGYTVGTRLNLKWMSVWHRLLGPSKLQMPNGVSPGAGTSQSTNPLPKGGVHLNYINIYINIAKHCHFYAAPNISPHRRTWLARHAHQPPAVWRPAGRAAHRILATDRTSTYLCVRSVFM